MTLHNLAKEICKREGLKKAVDIAQVKEILGIIGDIWYAEVEEAEWPVDRSTKATDVMLYLAGEKRAKRPRVKA